MIESYKKFLKSYRKEDDIPFNCPECKRPTLNLDQTTWLQNEQVSSVLERKQNDYFEPEWVKYTFTGTFKCMNQKCGEIVVASGSGSVIEEYTGYYVDEYGYASPCEREYVDTFYPKFFYPTLHFFTIPEKTPEDIKQIIIEAFSLTPNSPGAAANKIRIAIEILATEFGIKSKTSTGDFIPLHNRISNMSPQNDLYVHKDSMLAIKYIGNTGSHEDSAISFDELFDSFQIIDDLLKKLYPEKNMVNEIVKIINETKAPLTRSHRENLKN
ncbi:DUF4145 domain-containing protein [Acinetobacter baumannii]|uniref:DUF4145 domain-containing protein n=1 Tax=Acinetobacter baumannii TaxID=470 RepID=UPI001FF36290|nr:DUF4145 domain-containing protein [Acinetobacter baumannii]MCJ9043770.1 DUF4145 domain-containing protein [Acinetobacter baumannii]MCJ9146959.1 DUF4145 domain-containing protein [Acinetobacter baumannii]MCJ9295714.1 DUF4145 domain-containing protein [Acinetobacter baumannii]MCJ9511670.1 DUF4145 domain-containing protein [Acinetobacter baumannii]HAV2807928.1 DUF4145 domain-containing protein [Acinetobacter baumannii]